MMTRVDSLYVAGKKHLMYLRPVTGLFTTHAEYFYQLHIILLTIFKIYLRVYKKNTDLRHENKQYCSKNELWVHGMQHSG